MTKRTSRCAASGTAAIVSILAAGLVLTSCTSASTDSAANGRIAGVVYERGSVITTKPVAAAVTAKSKSSDGKTYSTRTAHDGSFSFDLPAGTYELTATLTDENAGGLATPENVMVTAGRTSDVKLYANFP
jgi:hypothetical protein